MKTTTIINLIFAGMVFITISSCKKDSLQSNKFSATQFDSAIARDWFSLQRTLIQETPGFSAPVAARSFGYAGITLYESVYQSMPGYQSLESKISGLAENTITKIDGNKIYHWGLVANAAMADIYRSLFKTASSKNLERIDAMEAGYVVKFKNSISQDELDLSVSYGKQIAKEIYAYSITDGQDECYKTNFPAYIPVVGPGKWIPTGAKKTPLQPYWGSMRPFIETNITLSQPPPPPSYSTASESKFYSEANEVYVTWRNLTSTQKDIADYWSDDPGKTSTPAGHIFYIATLVLEHERSDLSKAAEVYAKLGIAINDAFISCWKCKFENNLMRPVSYIQQVIDPNFNTYLSTPPSPEYTSGHSVQSGAGFTVLSDIFGSNYAFSDFANYGRTDINGSPRNFVNFQEAANQAAISRLYAGIHFRSAIERGLEQGQRIGSNTMVHIRLK